MKKILFCSLLALASLTTLAQVTVKEEPKKKDKNEPVVVEGHPLKSTKGDVIVVEGRPMKGGAEFDEVVIRKKGDKGTKVIIEIKGDKVTVNGKPIEDFEDGNVAVIKRRIPRVASTARGSGFRTIPDNVFPESLQGYPVVPGSPMYPEGMIYTGPTNKALLGVSTEKVEEGAKVISVSEKSAAEKAGLQKGDVITRINEDPIGSPEDLSLVIGKFKPEEKVTVSFLRDGKSQKAEAVLGKNMAANSYSINRYYDGMNNFKGLEGMEGLDNFNFNFKPFNGQSNAITVTGRPRLGIKAQETEEGDGLKVLEVWEESQAAKAGIKAGDIITQFDGKKVTTTEELIEASQESKTKTAVKVELKRDGKTQTVEIKQPKKLKTANL